MSVPSPVEDNANVVTVKQENTPVTTKSHKTKNYNEWYAHVNKFKLDNPGIPHAEAVRQPKPTYS